MLAYAVSRTRLPVRAACTAREIELSGTGRPLGLVTPRDSRRPIVKR